ncbi:hypothetical protein AOL_s00097g30 [Orbilia oligospora ATCC 24927]|uniref:Uncharacterized protein n=1 Tax=Arthrobotrys oligospora (strain ATCC 24927 / CBS 115.81 / DSM 1491) TaxID=756982 RepID=G1XI53_ARTOA|nr:hypothetical protein AOL_s00097g30 [Orbilia oligospora ATCC 24927]EGX47191.1 hypothetical protein AOL_s00097g30 [Orbilia oligospora ATCC 24927]
MSNPKVYTMPMHAPISVPFYVQIPPGAPIPQVFSQAPTNPKPGYVWGYPAQGYPLPPTATVMQGLGPDGTYGWPVYFKGGTSSNPQYAYYPVPSNAAPHGAVPVGGFPPGATFPGVPPPQGTSGKNHHRRRTKESSEEDDEKCACPECIEEKKHAGKAAPRGPTQGAPMPPPPPPPGHFISPQFFGPPPPPPPPAATTTQQTTTFIPYFVPSGCPSHHCEKGAGGPSDNHPSGHKHHDKKPSSSSYHYSVNCECPTCRARRMAIEMERIQEERKNEREYKDAQEFIKMKKRVDREDREAKLEGMYRAKKTGGKNVTFEEPPMCHHMYPEPEGDYEWFGIPIVPTSSIPIMGFHPGETTPIHLQPLHAGPSHYVDDLEEENARLRHEKSHLKDKIKRERSMRNNDNTARDYLSSRLRDLDKDVQELKKKGGKASGAPRSKTPVVEIQVPLATSEKHHHHKKSPSKEKGKAKDGDDSGDNRKGKNRNVESKHKHPHVCFDSECDDFDSCSECSFECTVKGCRTCRPRGGRR